MIMTGQATQFLIHPALTKYFRFVWTISYETFRDAPAPWLKAGGGTQ